jgi:hypothetical protein
MDAVKVPCSWCKTLVPVGTGMCEECGHEALAPRGECHCVPCAAERRRLAGRPEALRVLLVAPSGGRPVTVIGPFLDYREAAVYRAEKGHTRNSEIRELNHSLESFLRTLGPAVRPGAVVRVPAVGFDYEPLMGVTFGPNGARWYGRVWGGTYRVVGPCTIDGGLGPTYFEGDKAVPCLKIVRDDGRGTTFYVAADLKLAATADKFLPPLVVGEGRT